jgi:hypothetical protein
VPGRGVIDRLASFGVENARARVSFSATAHSLEEGMPCLAPTRACRGRWSTTAITCDSWAACTWILGCAGRWTPRTCQQTLLKAHENFAGFRGRTDAELRGWLRAILAQQLALIARKRGRRPVRVHSLESALEQSSARLESLLASQESSPSADAMHAERKRSAKPYHLCGRPCQPRGRKGRTTLSLGVGKTGGSQVESAGS